MPNQFSYVWKRDMLCLFSRFGRFWGALCKHGFTNKAYTCSTIPKCRMCIVWQQRIPHTSIVSFPFFSCGVWQTIQNKPQHLSIIPCPPCRWISSKILTRPASVQVELDCNCGAPVGDGDGRSPVKKKQKGKVWKWLRDSQEVGWYPPCK